MPPHVTSNFGWYARAMIALAVIAYTDPMAKFNTDMEREAPGWSVVWGPAELKDELGITYSRAFIAQRDTFDEYAVVIRGTNPVSWQSWTLQDFDVTRTVAFNTLPLAAGAPGSARISQGTFNGMHDLIRLQDSTRRSIVEFLQETQPGSLYVTGHSLGGTLTSPMFAYLNQVLYGGAADNMALFGFAGLAPGDAGFNAYLNGMVDPRVAWRFHNTLDIAPFLWWSLPNVQFIYGAHDLGWGSLEGAWLTHKFREANGQYAQPLGDYALTGVFYRGFLDQAGSDWTDQAMHQHHGSTYKALVDSAFSADTIPPAAARRRTMRAPLATPAGR